MMQKAIVAAGVGFCLPFMWTVLTLLLFSMPPSLLADAYWGLMRITYPFRPLASTHGELVAAVLNGGLYAGICFIVRAVRVLSSGQHESTAATRGTAGFLSRGSDSWRSRFQRERWWWMGSVCISVAIAAMSGLSSGAPLRLVLGDILVSPIILSPPLYVLLGLFRLLYWSMTTR